MALQAAVEQMNGAEVNEAHIEVEPAHGTPGSSGAIDKGSARSCSIFVKGFGPEVGLVTSFVTWQVHLLIVMICSTTPLVSKPYWKCLARVSISETRRMIHTIGGTNRCLEGPRGPMVLDSWVKAPSRICLDRCSAHTSATSLPGSGLELHPEHSQSMTSHNI